MHVHTRSLAAATLTLALAGCTTTPAEPPGAQPTAAGALIRPQALQLDFARVHFAEGTTLLHNKLVLVNGGVAALVKTPEGKVELQTYLDTPGGLMLEASLTVDLTGLEGPLVKGALEGGGNTLVVALQDSPGTSQVLVYERADGFWEANEQGSVSIGAGIVDVAAEEGAFSVALGPDINGVPFVLAYTRNDGTWGERTLLQDKITGRAPSVSMSPLHLAVPQQDFYAVFERQAESWEPELRYAYENFSGFNQGDVSDDALVMYDQDQITGTSNAVYVMSKPESGTWAQDNVFRVAAADLAGSGSITSASAGTNRFTVTYSVNETAESEEVRVAVFGRTSVGWALRETLTPPATSKVDVIKTSVNLDDDRLTYVNEEGGLLVGYYGRVAPKFAFDGFYMPLQNTPALNLVKAGASVAVKFSLGGDYGLNILESGYPQVTPMACDGDAAAETVLETSSTGNSGLTYDAESGQYTYVWRTPRSLRSTCAKFALRLVDGNEHELNFQFR